MAQLFRLESATDDPFAGGFIVEFPSGARKVVPWHWRAPMPDTKAAAKEFADKVLTQLLSEGRIEDADRTNWPSLIAAIQRIVSDWNDVLRAHLYAHPVVDSQTVH